VFVVLRAQTDAVQTIGPTGQAFTSFKQADAFAKEMRDQYSHQTFYVCQTVAVYEVQSRATVKKIALPEPQKKRTKEMNPKGSEPAAPSPPNVYPMPARVNAVE
jgi:hypothetical protein